MDPEQLEKARRKGAAEAEQAVILWIRAQAKIARTERRPYIARWLERLSDAIERGEYRVSPM